MTFFVLFVAVPLLAVGRRRSRCYRFSYIVPLAGISATHQPQPNKNINPPETWAPPTLSRMDWGSQTVSTIFRMLRLGNNRPRRPEEAQLGRLTVSPAFLVSPVCAAAALGGVSFHIINLPWQTHHSPNIQENRQPPLMRRQHFFLAPIDDVRRRGCNLPPPRPPSSPLCVLLV